ncbi:DcrB-related protein [Ilumatobacter sp.]|uniref:DcrB-related protein n=1 Tax=Ilumatobacter sp. TaxID=1967498 RepID=UPI0037532DA8
MLIEESELIHFYNPDTKTSIELPVGWEEQSAADGTAVYVDLDEDDNDEKSPRLIVSIRALPSAGDVRAAVLDAMLSGLDGAEVLDRRETLVDDSPASRIALRYTDGELGPVVRVQGVVQEDDVLWTFVGIAPGETTSEQRNVFENAFDSVRLILL